MIELISISQKCTTLQLSISPVKMDLINISTSYSVSIDLDSDKFSLNLAQVTA